MRIRIEVEHGNNTHVRVERSEVEIDQFGERVPRNLSSFIDEAVADVKRACRLEETS